MAWTGYTVNRNFKPYSLAREFVRSLGLRNREEWYAYCKSGKKPTDIPSNPDKEYEKEWTGIADWIGYDGTWTVVRIKSLLRDLINSKIIFEWDEAVLYSLLLRKGLLNLDVNNNRHAYFFKNLLQATQTNEGRKIIEADVNSDSEIPPDLSNFSKEHDDNLEEIGTASNSELPHLTENVDPLDYDKVETVEQILRNSMRSLKR